MLKSLVKHIYETLRPVRIQGRNNTCQCGSKIGRDFHIEVSGNNNEIKIGKECLLTNTRIQITGDNSRVIIEDKVSFMGPCHIIVGAGSSLIIRKNAGIRGGRI